MTCFTTLTSKIVPLPVDNVDTDQIIPARFLKVTDKAGLGDNLFADWRYDAEGNPKPDFVLNRPEMKGRQVLLVGDNFGCGSSREHAPWALTGYGFRAVISTSFADIFRNNALKNRLLPVIVDKPTHQQLFSLCEEAPDFEVTIDLAAQTLTLPDGRAVGFPIDAFSKACLLNGVDEIGYVLRMTDQILAFEAAHHK
ncbi:MAG: 3-isopropylmalate dehydratase small subunit [Chloroflexi bacterium]|jgi:3-isopropylmalate/(R)-2-methylmalate dehydratase small subunit|uniref:3-isopropylmalate dehydratase small subunit n=1 Tax=Candidatus Thermofonsia Clade 3 bacterium TaxID=2364212 RepID=A0A2M8QFS9_9CHLR|nr:3-isopropylmalate dehydratase small subunit [Candidatus Roseilinea sp. NK_OTU-006]PJF48670.1 MAG: 3-isopropylmalate dehydratase small subunit [Candidatus Thermofonsia Clade 3 bacterium]RMG64101.1 MAG: 3-isopropylmalate dehydratase small subunit [Chloroflexota bacterium]